MTEVDTNASSIAIGGSLGGVHLVRDGADRLRVAAFGPSLDPFLGDVPAELYPLALPTSGDWPPVPGALAARYGDGRVVRGLRVRTMSSDGPALVAGLRDVADGVDVQMRFVPIEDVGLLSQSLVITNVSAQPVAVDRAPSSIGWPLLDRPQLHHFGGGWSREWTPRVSVLGDAPIDLRTHGSVQPHLERAPVFFLTGTEGLQEEHGSVAVALIEWTGNLSVVASADANGLACVSAGMGLDVAYLLEPGERLETPEVVWGFSDAGVALLSDRLHRYIRGHRLRHPDRERAIVWNNWEATGFDFDDRRLDGIVDEAAELGAELFLLDDGWFGVEPARNDDTTSLGDWIVDPVKFPNGLQPVIDRALGHGLRFGLWIEPEMVNPESQLFAEHPDWVVAATDGPAHLHRHQLVLDVRRDDVQRFIKDMIQRLIDEHRGISYVKWDANRPITEYDAVGASAHERSHFAYEWSKAAEGLMQWASQRFEGVEWMLCASGGGRMDTNALRWFDEIWPSDNTDPRARVRMQWAMSYVFPAQVIGAHVTRWGQRPIAFGCAVAMSARFGFDLDPAGLSEDERDTVRAANDLYRRIRPIVQFGRLRRLISPLDGPRGALMYDAGDAVVFGFQLEEGSRATPLRIDGLRPEQNYAVTSHRLSPGERPAAYETTGATLMQTGLWWPLTEATSAVVWTINAVDHEPRSVIDLTDIEQ